MNDGLRAGKFFVKLLKKPLRIDVRGLPPCPLLADPAVLPPRPFKKPEKGFEPPPELPPPVFPPSPFKKPEKGLEDPPLPPLEPPWLLLLPP